MKHAITALVLAAAASLACAAPQQDPEEAALRAEIADLQAQLKTSRAIARAAKAHERRAKLEARRDALAIKLAGVKS